MEFITKTGCLLPSLCNRVVNRLSGKSCLPFCSKRWFGQPVSLTHPHLLQEGQVTPGILKEEYQFRRSELMGAIASKNKSKDNVLVLIPSAPKLYMAHDVPYPFRQNSDFLYLSGFQEPDSILVLEMDGNQFEYKSSLFVPRKDPLRELWDGPRTGRDGAVWLTGVDQAFDVDDFDAYLQGWCKDKRTFAVWYEHLKPPHLEYHVRHMLPMLREHKNVNTRSPRNFIQTLRLIKSPAEIQLMQESCALASKCFEDVMKFSRPGAILYGVDVAWSNEHAQDHIDESHLYAKMDFECRLRGAERLAYPPVVAGGNRANTIHYINNNQLIRDGEMVLMDAGCEYHGYCSDITRTWPINGTFTRWQRDLYEALLEVQLDCIKLCRADSLSMNDIFIRMLALLGKQLQQLGIIPRSFRGDDVLAMTRQFCPHHVSHYLGMDVHDVDEIPRTIQLKPGMIITIEPGIYIPESRMDVAKEWRGMGLRIEDDILITSAGPRNLSEPCPKTPDAIERIMRSN